MNIRETCKCGSVFNVSGETNFCSNRYREFLEAHKACRAAPKERKKERVFMIFCKRTECVWYQFMGNPGVHLCTRKVVHHNEKGECVMFIRKKDKPEKCPWPCDEMVAYAGRNFCPFCGRDLREEVKE